MANTEIWVLFITLSSPQSGFVAEMRSFNLDPFPGAHQRTDQPSGESGHSGARARSRRPRANLIGSTRSSRSPRVGLAGVLSLPTIPFASKPLSLYGSRLNFTFIIGHDGF